LDRRHEDAGRYRRLADYRLGPRLDRDDRLVVGRVAAKPICCRPLFRVLQFCSASLYSLGHGGNDAQKTMGVITALLFTQGYLGGQFHVPLWVVLSCHAAMAVGTLIGGWRIVHTMGSRITHIKPMQGFCAELGGATTIFAAIASGTPISTTHTIAGSIAGVGLARKGSSVRWDVSLDIIFAWVLTLPAAAFIAAIVYAATVLIV
jgi:inorganic phosphate transporter, PiT family